MSKAIRRIPVLGWFGIALLAFSLGVVIWISGMGHAAEEAGTPPPKSGPSRVAASYAYGDVEPGVAKLYTLYPSRVVKILKHDNDVVEKDAPLVQLDDTVAKADLDRANSALRAAEKDLETAKAQAEFLPKEHAEKIAGQEAGVAAKKAELEAAQKKRDHAKRFKGNGVSQEDVDAAEAAVRGYEAAVKIEEAKLRGLEAAEPTVRINATNLVAKAQEQIKEKKELVAKAEWALRECTIKAPAKGTVLRVMVAEGDVLGPNPREPAVMFCPDGPRILRAEVEQEFAGRLSLNQTAVVRDDSSNSPLMTGKVTRISDWYSHRRSMVQEPLQFNDVRTVECIIALDPNDKTPLRIGQRVRVTFEGN